MFITDDEIKATVVCKFGYFAIGLVGVWDYESFREDLDQFDWKGRRAGIFRKQPLYFG